MAKGSAIRLASFLMLDQPSQAFFPGRWPGDREEGAAEASESVVRYSEDIVRVQRIFRVLTHAVELSQERLQIVVVDHADEITWEGLPVHLVERWRGERAPILE